MSFKALDLPPYPSNQAQTLGIEGGGPDLHIYPRNFEFPLQILRGSWNPRSPLVEVLEEELT